MVRFEHVRYSVPARHARLRVDVEAAAGAIRIRSGDLILAEHRRCFQRDARVEDPLDVLVGPRQGPPPQSNTPIRDPKRSP
jgi:hypothetical protein